MKKMKKILAMLLALTMVLGMSLTSMAEAVTDATTGLEIPVTGAGDAAAYKHAQLIEVDTTTETGWKFSSDAIAEKFINAFDAVSTDDEEPTAQAVIWQLIKKQAGNEVIPGMPVDTTAAADGDIAEALRNIKNASPAIITLVNGKKVYAPGVYFIDVEESGYAYNPMTAYVSFYSYEGKNAPSGLSSAGTVAKRVDIQPEKTNNNGDAVTEIGKEVTYTITTTVPYITADNNSNFTITDTISGAEYKLSGAEMVVSVKIGSGNAFNKNATLTPEKDSFTLDLTTEAKTEGNAGKALVITYTAIVTDTVVHNSVTSTDGEHNASTNNYLFTGTVKLTKIDADNETKKLEGAEFVVRKSIVTGEGEAATTTYTYAVCTTVTDATGKITYEVSDWITEDEYEADKVKVEREYATNIATDAKGEVSVAGLDNSEIYEFIEVIAPTGYSVNETPSPITWTTSNETRYVVKKADGKVEDRTTVADKANGEEKVYNYTKTIATGTAEMSDTKLNALPSTGGIGTTIFTVAGCGIMIAAAFFFFASRKKESN